MTETSQAVKDNSIHAKQAYLRLKIAPDKYEDFSQFCESVAGNVNIEEWQIDYVKDLVHRFNKQEKQKNKDNLRQTHSFHLYQTGNADQIKKVSQEIKKEEKPSETQIHIQKVEQPKQRGKSPMPLKQKQQKSALDVLDSIFEQHNSSSNNQFQTKKYDKSFFQSCNFWGVPNEQPVKKEPKPDTPTKPKGSPNKTVGNILPVDPDNFQKLFQTGMDIPEVKPAPSKAKSPTKTMFQQISFDEQILKPQTKKAQQKPKVIQVAKQQKKVPIKLVSVKDIKQAKLPYQGEILIKKPFKTTVACFKSIEREALSHKNLKIKIDNHQIVNRSFFSSDYTMYHLKVMPTQITCKRNLEDFQKLKSNLEQVYPGVRLPYLEKHGWLQSEISPENISRQKKYLQFFLEDIISHNELRNSRILQDFLTLKDHKQMKRKFQQYEKLKKISSIQQLCLLQGQVKVEMSEENRQYNQYLSALMDKVNSYWTAKEGILANIDALYLNLMNNYKSLSELTQNMKKQIKQFNRRVKLNEIECLEGALDSLQRYCNQNMTNNLNESCFLETSLLPFIRYQKENMNLLNTTIQIRNNLTRQYLKRKDNEKGNDNIEYLSERLKQFKTDILQESKNITVLKYQCGYINQLTASEGHHYYQKLSHKIIQLIGSVCSQKLGYLSKTINTYTELIQS